MVWHKSLGLEHHYKLGFNKSNHPLNHSRDLCERIYKSVIELCALYQGVDNCFLTQLAHHNAVRATCENHSPQTEALCLLNWHIN